MIRSFDAELVNSIVNDPSVRPHVGGDGTSYIDLTAIVEDDKNHAILGPHGGFLCTWSAPETYEIHTFILPDGRGPEAAALALATRDYLEGIGATHLWTRVEKTMENVRKFTLAAGFKPCGEQTLDLGGGPTAYELFNWRPSCQQQ